MVVIVGGYPRTEVAYVVYDGDARSAAIAA
jgi:hypothetical protein